MARSLKMPSNKPDHDTEINFAQTPVDQGCTGTRVATIFSGEFFNRI